VRCTPSYAEYCQDVDGSKPCAAVPLLLLQCVGSSNIVKLSPPRLCSEGKHEAHTASSSGMNGSMYAVNAVQHTYILHICKQLLVAQLLIYVPTWLCFYAIVPGYSSSDDQLCDGSSGTAGHLCPWGCQHSRHRCCTAPGIHCCDMSILPYSLQTLCVCLCVLSLY
jgi:hypothetical protein